MKEKYTKDQYTDMLGKLKELFEDILSLNDKKEKLKFKYFNEFKSYVDSYIKNNPFAKISDYGLQSPGGEPIREQYPSKPKKEEKLGYRDEPKFYPDIKHYVLAYIASFCLMFGLISNFYVNNILKRAFDGPLMGGKYPASNISKYMIEFVILLFIFNFLYLNSKYKNKKMKKKTMPFTLKPKLSYFFSLVMLYLVYSEVKSVEATYGSEIEISLIYKYCMILLIFILSLIGPFYFYKKDKSIFINANKDIFDYNDYVREKNREIEEFNATYNQRMHNFQSKCKEIDNEYYRQKANYEKNLDEYNTKMSRIEYEVELKNKNIQKIRNEEIAIYKKNYEQILKEEVDKIDLKLSELFAEIGKQLEGKWLPKYYWDLNHISTLLNYFERRNAYTMQEASNHIRDDERTESIIENQNKNMEMIIDSMNKQSRLLENIIKNQNYSNYLQEENLRNVDEIRDRARMVNYQLDFMTENQEQMKSILNSIDINTLKNLTESKIANYQLGGVLGELTYLNIQASAIKNNTSSMNQSLGNINSNVGKIYNRYYGR